MRNLRKLPLAVIIPFYSRGDALARTLSALSTQLLAPELFEVIVINDGSPEDMTWLEQREYPFPLKILQQGNRGPSAARNLGIGNTDADNLLFLDADIIADQDLLVTHLNLHRENNKSLIIGAVWPYRKGQVSFADQTIDWEIGDTRSGYAWTEDEEIICLPFYDVISNNLSLRRETFDCLGPFDESLRGCEDVEYGYRAKLNQIQVLYAPGAIGYHNHSRTLEARLLRHQKYASFRPLIIEKHPELSKLIPAWIDEPPINIQHDSLSLVRRKLTRRILANSLILKPMYFAALVAERKQVWPRLFKFLYWQLISSYEYRGFSVGLPIITPLSGK